ncbi:hypothetical protein Tco_0316281 [Tanacetum coccineum]
MSTLQFADTHNMVSFLSKPTESDRFEQIVDFLNVHTIRYALTVDPAIYVSYGQEIVITKASVRRDLQLADAEGVDCLPNSTIFENLALMGPKITGWNEFSSNLASTIICLATNQTFNFPKLIFDGMVRNLDSPANVADETVYEDRDDILVRATTTASSLEAYWWFRVPRNHGGIIAQARLENVSKHSNDPLLAEAKEIAKLKRKVNKLQKHKKSRTPTLRRLHKVGRSVVIVSSANDDLDEEDASKEGRNTIDIDFDMFSVHDLEGEKIFAEPNVADVVSEVVEVVKTVDAVSATGDELNAASVPVTIVGDTNDDMMTTTTAALAELKSTRRTTTSTITTPTPIPTTLFLIPTQDKGKGKMLEEEPDDVQAKVEADLDLAQRLQAEEQAELTDAEKAKLFMEFLEKKRKFFAAKRTEEKRNKPPTQAQQKNLSMKRVNNFVDFREELVKGSEKVEESTKKAEAELEGDEKELKQCLKIVPDDEDDVTIDAIPLASKPLMIVDWKIHRDGKKTYF